MFFLYNITIYAYHGLIQLSAVGNKKAKLWVKGRKGIFERLRNDFNKTQRIAWFHAASLGEFEQGRPVMEAFKKANPEIRILLTFFSPSGYEIRKDYPGADYIYYLPIDTPGNVKHFVSIVKPELAIFIKYEFWFNYLRELHRKNIPVYIISAIVRPEQHFFKSWGGWFRKQLSHISTFFVQDKNSAELLKSIGQHNVIISGDTRFDRVADIADQRKDYPLIEKFAGKNKVLLAGSTWPPDEKLLQKFIKQSSLPVKYIIAPHEIHEERIVSIQKAFQGVNVLKYSQLNESNADNADVLIIDGMGFLSSLYQYCSLAFIGGGFGKGIHNILEAVTFGKPVVFGPRYEKFAEARNLVNLGGAFAINENSFLSTIEKLLSNETFYLKASETCSTYIEKNTGATQIILENIKV